VTEHELKQHLLQGMRRLMLDYGTQVMGPADLQVSSGVEVRSHAPESLAWNYVLEAATL
jgi:hypothetical protein